MESQASHMNCKDQPEQRSYGKRSMTATSDSWRALLSLSWYTSVPGGQLTLRYPGCQRHGSGAVQAYLRGQSLKEKIGRPPSRLTRRARAWIRPSGG